MQLVNSGCLNMFNYIQKSGLKSSFLESLASLDSLLYPTENELSGSRNSEWNLYSCSSKNSLHIHEFCLSYLTPFYYQTSKFCIQKETNGFGAPLTINEMNDLGLVAINICTNNSCAYHAPDPGIAIKLRW